MNKKITEEAMISLSELKELLNICEEPSEQISYQVGLIKDLVDIIYKEKCMTLEQLKRIPAESIVYYYMEEDMDSFKYYFDSLSETTTHIKDIKDGYSYTLATVMDNGYSVELDYCNDHNPEATIRYGEKEAHDSWNIEIETADWFNLNLSDEYVLNRLNCIYNEKYLDRSLSEEKTNEINLLEHILNKHKVYDIHLDVDIDNNIVAYDDENFWIGNEFYDFIFDELFVYNKENKVDLIDDNDYKKLCEFREKYIDKTKEIEEEMEHEF